MTGIVRILPIYLSLSCILSLYVDASIMFPATIEYKEVKRPVMHTFFELQTFPNGKQVPKEEHDELLYLWQTLWREAGWDTKILTMDDARKHPDFEMYTRGILEDEEVWENSYNYMCFVRWLAMDANGEGGFITDYDTYPMGLKNFDGSILPNGGRFTVFQMFVPALISGTANEWSRMTKKIFDIAIKKSTETHAHVNSDMYALFDMYHETPDDCHWENLVYGGYPYTRKNVVDCKALEDMQAVHLSHYATQLAFQKGLFDIKHHESNRHLFARDLSYNWKEQCF